MTTKRKLTLCNVLPRYEVGDTVTIYNHDRLSYNKDMDSYNDRVVTITEAILQDTRYWYTDNEIIEAHKHRPVYSYKFSDNSDDINDWNWYSYDFKESYKKLKVKLYKK